MGRAGGGRADGLLRVLGDMVWNYPGLTFANQDRDSLIQLIDDIRYGNIRHSANTRETPTGWDSLTELYAWMPGNLFIGPSNRADDPGSNFDTPALPVVGGNNYNELLAADSAIERYVNSNSPRDAQVATISLSRIARHQTLYDLNALDWVLVNATKPEYRVRSQSQLELEAQHSAA
jgi:hypothetical protein